MSRIFTDGSSGQATRCKVWTFAGRCRGGHSPLLQVCSSPRIGETLIMHEGEKEEKNTPTRTRQPVSFFGNVVGLQDMSCPLPLHPFPSTVPIVDTMMCLPRVLLLANETKAWRAGAFHC